MAFYVYNKRHRDVGVLEQGKPHFMKTKSSRGSIFDDDTTPY